MMNVTIRGVRSGDRVGLSMIYKVTRLIVLLLGLLPALAAAEPVTLKLAYFSSDRTHLYRSGAEPFVNAVNRAGRGRVKIETYFSGRLEACRNSRSASATVPPISAMSSRLTSRQHFPMPP